MEIGDSTETRNVWLCMRFMFICLKIPRKRTAVMAEWYNPCVRVPEGTFWSRLRIPPAALFLFFSGSASNRYNNFDKYKRWHRTHANEHCMATWKIIHKLNHTGIKTIWMLTIQDVCSFKIKVCCFGLTVHAYNIFFGCNDDVQTDRHLINSQGLRR